MTMTNAERAAYNALSAKSEATEGHPCPWCKEGHFVERPQSPGLTCTACLRWLPSDGGGWLPGLKERKACISCGRYRHLGADGSCAQGLCRQSIKKREAEREQRRAVAHAALDEEPLL